MTVHVHDDKYADGIYLLYPRNATAAQVFVDFNLWIETQRESLINVSQQNSDVDVIFVHGNAG